MRMNVLLFTETMHSLLKSSLPLQEALSVCQEIFSTKKERAFCRSLLKKINEGALLSSVLQEYGGLFPLLYLSLVRIGEESGMLPDVFGKLSNYLKTKREMRRKIAQALAYPVLVLSTAIVVIFVIVFFVLPRLSGIFEAFAESSVEMGEKVASVKANLFISVIILAALCVIAIICFVLHRINENIAYNMDAVALRIPFLGNVLTTMQMQDFAFAMKLLTSTHFPFVQSLKFSSQVLSNKRLRGAVLFVYEEMSRGCPAGESFRRERVFPPYLTVWVGIAERNGDIAGAFGQICDYYSNENSNITAGIAAFAEPAFILLTGALIIAFIGQLVVPIFKLLGTL